MRERLVVFGSATGALGVALAGLFSASCCLVPALFGLLGASGVVAAHALEPYRPLMLGVSVLALGVGFWWTYRPRPAAECRDVELAPGRGRVSRLLLWTAALAVVASSAAFVVVP